MINEIRLHVATREDFEDAAMQLTNRGIIFMDYDKLTDTNITMTSPGCCEDFETYFDVYEEETVILVENAKSGCTTVTLAGYAEAKFLQLLTGKDLNIQTHKAGDLIELEGEVNPIDATAEEKQTFYHVPDAASVKQLLEEADRAGYEWYAGQQPLELYDLILDENTPNTDIIIVVEASPAMGNKKLAASDVVSVVDHGDGDKIVKYTGQSLG